MIRKLLASVKQWADTVKRDVHAIWLAGRDSRTPRIAKLIALAVAAYAISPIDLIPDFIPIIGYLDDLIILPLGVVLVIRLIPKPLMAEFRLAALNSSAQPVSRIAAVLIVAVWVVCLAFLISFFYTYPRCRHDNASMQFQ